MRVSVITPTIRPDRLDRVKDMVFRQTAPVHEWLVMDDPGMTIGAKRNDLVARATGDVIAHFDDDDLYGATYLEEMLAGLGDLDLYKLSRYTAVCEVSGRCGIVDLLDRSGMHRRFPGGELVDLGPDPNPDPWAFGATFLYRRSAWEAHPFPDVSWNEDGALAAAIYRKGHGPGDAFIKFCHPGCSSTTYVRA